MLPERQDERRDVERQRPLAAERRSVVHYPLYLSCLFLLVKVFFFHLLHFLAIGVFLLAVGCSEEVFNLHFSLQLHHAVEERFRTRGATWHVNVNGDDIVNALHHVV